CRDALSTRPDNLQVGEADHPRPGVGAVQRGGHVTFGLSLDVLDVPGQVAGLVGQGRAGNDPDSVALVDELGDHRCSPIWFASASFANRASRRSRIAMQFLQVMSRFVIMYRVRRWFCAPVRHSGSRCISGPSSCGVAVCTAPPRMDTQFSNSFISEPPLFCCLVRTTLRVSPRPVNPPPMWAAPHCRCMYTSGVPNQPKT